MRKKITAVALVAGFFAMGAVAIPLTQTQAVAEDAVPESVQTDMPAVQDADSAPYAQAEASPQQRGSARAFVFSNATGAIDVNQRGGGDALFSLSIGTSTGIEAVHTELSSPEGGLQTLETPQFITRNGMTVDYKLTSQVGLIPFEAYRTAWSCTIDGKEADEGSVTTERDRASVSISGNQVAACKVDVVTAAPKTYPAETTIKAGETAKFQPQTPTELGVGALEAVTFDNGKSEKTVEGEGQWSIELVDNQPIATFVPAEGFTGAITQQQYTITDQYGLFASSTLDVTITPASKPDDGSDTPPVVPVTPDEPAVTPDKPAEEPSDSTPATPATDDSKAPAEAPAEAPVTKTEDAPKAPAAAAPADQPQQPQTTSEKIRKVLPKTGGEWEIVRSSALVGGLLILAGALAVFAARIGRKEF